MRARSSVAGVAGVISVIAVAALATGCSEQRPAGASSDEVLHVVLDYSPTLSDAGALLYLASNPSVDLLAVTLPGTGEADCDAGTRTTRSLLAIAGKSEVPIGCGRETPLVGNRDWPVAWRLEASSWGDDVLPPTLAPPAVDAEALLVDTLEAASSPITIVAVAPLTNLAAVLTAHPEFEARIAHIVIMGGAVAVPGNVEDAPTAEWNLYIDPEAARRVINSNIEVTLVPLDATNHVPWTERLLRRLETLEAQPARTVRQLATSRESLEGFFLWDELAAVVAVHRDVVTIERRSVTIDSDGAVVDESTSGAIDVAVDADADLATAEFLTTLNGGNLPQIVPLTSAELDYMIALNGADGRFTMAIDRAYVGLDTSEDNSAGGVRAVAVAFVESFLGAVDAYASEVAALTPPPSVADLDEDYVDVLREIADSKADVEAALGKAAGSDAGTLLDEAMSAKPLDSLFQRARDLCQNIEDYSFLHGGPRPCSAAAEQ